MDEGSARLGPLLRVGLAAVILLGFALRLGVSLAAYCSTFDTATVGLMALHILKGERPLFYYGQSYMGSLEAYLAAILFKLLGPSEIALSMSPILFSLAWIGATYLLFKELLGTRAGLIAALCIAVPGWHILWYCIGSYGGYPAAFFFGTAALWVVVRITGRDVAGLALWSHALALGVLAGLALWTNFISAAYLLTGACLLGVHFVRKRFAPRLILPFAAGGLPLLLGILPAIVSYRRFSGKHVLQWNPSAAVILDHFRKLFDRPLQDHVFPPWDEPLAVKIAVLAILAATAAICIWRVVCAENRLERRRLLLPTLFAAAFLALYLPHPLADSRVARYTIPLWTILTCGMFASAATTARPWIRRSATALLAMWLFHCAVSDVFAAHARADRKRRRMAERQEIADSAIKAGMRSVFMVGGQIFGHEGQILTFAARDAVSFVSTFDDRCQLASQNAEADPMSGLVCGREDLSAVRAALDELAVAYRVEEHSRFCLFHDLRAHPLNGCAVPPDQLSVEPYGAAKGVTQFLTDRDDETSAKGTCDGQSGFTIDTGKERNLLALVLFSSAMLQDTLPRGYDILVSKDNRDYRLIRRVERRTSPSYVSGNRAYLKGYYGMTECRFAPVSARYVRLVAKSAQRGRTDWRLSEVFVFEKAGESSVIEDQEVEAIAAAISARGVDFTVCDRWLSARLLAALPAHGGHPPAFPRYNPNFKDTELSRVIQPQAGLALAVSSAFAEACETLLRECYGEAAKWSRVDFEHYALFIFETSRNVSGARFSLFWNGHTILKTKEPESF